MNFHKTIGFLAALLLTLGIGVPDSFAQNETIDVTVTPARITEGQSRSVTVSVTLSEAPGAGNTVTVSLAEDSGSVDGVNLAVVHDADGTETDGFEAIEIVGTATTGMSVATITANEDDDDATEDTNYNHPRDKDVTITATATGGTATYDPGEGTLQVREDDSPIGAITLSADPPGLSVGGGGSTELTASVVTAPDGNDIAVSITSMLTVGDADPVADATANITIADGDKEGMASLSSITVTAAGSITITGSAVGYTPGMVTVPIIQRNAGDVEGFRVTIISHDDDDWVGSGAKKVDVQVRRVNRFAWDWTNFENLVVALRDTSTTGGGLTGSNIYTLTVSGFAEVDEDIKFSKGAPTGQNATASNTAIAYSKANDAFTFEFHLQAIAGATNTAEAVLGTDTNPQEQGRIDEGQRHGVYATATFTHDDGTGSSTTTTLNSNDTKTEVYESPSALVTVPAADQVVGDGKLIKLDLMAPANIADNNLVVTLKEKALVEDNEIKVNDEITIAVNIDAQSRFRDGGVQVQVLTLAIPTQNPGTVAGKANRILKTANFTQVDVINAAGDALETSLKFTEGLVKAQAAAKSKTRDGANINLNVVFQPDNAPIRIRARTKDQAGNFSGFTNAQLDLIADTRKPVIEVMYPAADDYFAGAIGDTDTGFDQFLKPLKIRVDEPVASMDVYVHKNHKLAMWADENQNFDRSLSIGDAVGSVGDTIVYDTQGLKINDKAIPNTDPVEKGEGSKPGGSKVNLVIEVTDKVGNKTTKTLTGVFHDEQAPKVTDFFPSNALLTSDNEINDATRHPVITLPETVDSIAVVYDGSSGDDIVETVSGVNSGQIDVPITEAFVQDRTYTLTIFARDRAGNAADSDPTLAADMKFNAQFDNPEANEFTVSNLTGNADPTKSSAGVIAGQAFNLAIQAIDNGGTDATTDDLDAVTYKSEVRISASSESVRFSGKGVTDNGDGSATLDAAEWKLGARTVYAKSEMAVGDIEILVQHLDAAGDEVFNGSIEDLYVDAADFARFNVTAMQNGIEVEDLNPGSFDLEIVPADKYGNPSTKAFAADPSSVADSLALLDSEVAKNNAANVEFDTIPVDFRSIPAYDDLSLGWDFTVDGDIFSLDAPADRTRVTITISIVDDDLEPANARTEDIRTQRVSFAIVAPLTPMLTLWGPNGEDWTDETTISVAGAAEGDMITVQAQGYDPNSMVTFSDGTEVTADAEGNASLMLPFAEGTVTLSATDGRYPAPEKTWMFEATPPEPMRMEFATAGGNPVYLVDLVTDGTVNAGDYALFRAAWGSSVTDDINGDGMADDTDVQIFLQSDVHPADMPDGMVNSLDYALFITTWDSTAVDWSPPSSSKPIVLLPGINENAEFSLNLGSERVVAGELVAVDVSLANVEALVAYGFTLNYDTDKFEFVSVAPADEDLLTSTGGESMLFHNVRADGQVEVVNGVFNGTAVSGGGDIVRFVFRVLYEFEDNARFEIADGLVFDPTNLTNPAVVAGVLELQSTPREFALHQNFPNPFNPDTTIKYDLAESADVTLQIYNVLGQVVRTLVASEMQNAGRYQIRWNGMDDRGVLVSSGVYFYRISADGKFQQVQKLMLLK